MDELRRCRSKPGGVVPRGVLPTGARWRPGLLLAALVVSAVLACLPRIDVLAGGLVPVSQALHPVLSLGALAAALVLAASRQLGAAALLTAGLAVGLLPTLIPAAAGMAAEAPASGSVTVFSLNVQHAQAEEAEIRRILVGQRPQIVVLVEVDEPFIDRVLAGGVGDQLPYRSPAVSGGGSDGTVILSAYPLANEPAISSFDSSRRFDQPVAVASHPDLGQLRVAAIHITAPVVRAGQVWREGLESLERWQRENDSMPLVLAGDFNATYAHPAFRRVAGSLADSAAEAGPFAAPTWPSQLPFAAIDHVLARGLAPLQWQRVEIGNSDHRGLLVRLAGIEAGSGGAIGDSSD